jgi:hypothetical protein
VAEFRPTAPAGATVAGASWPAPVHMLASDASLGDRFGAAVAVSGSYAIVGAHTDDATFPDAGSAYIFRYDGTTEAWIEEQKLVAPDPGNNDRFGAAVDIISSVAGDVAVVGAFLEDNDGGLDAGSAYVFRRNAAGTWVFEHKLLASDRFPGDFFGRGVAITRDDASDVIVVGAPQDDDGGSATGSAYVFRKSGAAWMQEQKLTAPDAAANDQFGQSVDIGYSLADTSQWVIVGAWMEDAAATDSGSAYLFEKGSNWNYVTKLIANDGGVLDQMGFDVALAFADDVRLAFAGAWKHNNNSVSNTGAAYVFASTGGSWAQELKIVPADVLAEDSFGVCVDAHEDGLIVGSYLADTTAADAGAAYIFRRTGTGWTQEAKLMKDAPAANEQAGFGVGLGGETALVGVWLDDTVNSDAGALLISSRGAAPPFNDCNKNGIPDECDILSGTSLDLNGNGIPDECEEPPPPTCPADVNNSGAVDSDDLVAVILAWGICPVPPGPCPADANNSGTVDSDDLVLVILNWGACP